MRIQDKIEKIVNKPFTIDDLEKIADDYAIEFAYFIERIKDADIDSLDYNFYLTYTMEQLLEIFKKEKGL